jgi:hypothetical protein
MRRVRPPQLVSAVLSVRISRRRRISDEIEDPPPDSSFKCHQLMMINVIQVMIFHHRLEW